jgi:hypothetical protein
MWVTACNLTMYTEVMQVELFKFGFRNPLRIETYRVVHKFIRIIIVFLIEKLLITRHNLLGR